ncbi:MAG: prolipoprotein diacylglyceryl transferase [Balneola sp.]
MSLIDKLKSHWGIESTSQVIVILIVFACTGFTALYAREFVFDLLGVTNEFPFWQRALIWVVTILPLYNLFLYIYGTIFGQREFFTLFLKKTFGRLIPGKKTSKKEA